MTTTEKQSFQKLKFDSRLLEACSPWNGSIRDWQNNAGNLGPQMATIINPPQTSLNCSVRLTKIDEQFRIPFKWIGPSDFIFEWNGCRAKVTQVPTFKQIRQISLT